MAAIISSQMAYSGVSIYAIVRAQAVPGVTLGNVANGSGLESYLLANYSTYKIPMSEQVPTGYFQAAFPTYLPAGTYSFSIHQGTGVAGDPSVDRGILDWNGLSENYTGVLANTIPELTAVPSATPTIVQAIMFLYMALRNLRTTNATNVNICNAGGATITTAIRSDDGTTGTKGRFN
jgi:hypothetical protein